jgi:hypothetical protein
MIEKLEQTTAKVFVPPSVTKFITHPDEAPEQAVVKRDMYNRRVTVFDHLCENDSIEDEKTRNPYVHFFCTRLPALHTFRDNNLENWRSFFNKTTMKKEVTESGAIVYRVMQLFQNELAYMVNDDKYKIVFFDCCSGKGFTSVMLSLLFPRERCSIVMLDKDLKMKLEHINSLPNVKFEHFYIYPLHKGGMEKTAKLMKAKLDKEQKLAGDEKKVVGIILASHLCVHLSEVMVHIYKELENMKALILSPCCAYENEHNKCWFDMVRGLEVEDDFYSAWNMYLYRSIVDHTSPDAVKCHMSIDKDVMSPKNYYIVTSKQDK